MNKPLINAWEAMLILVAACLLALLLHHFKPLQPPLRANAGLREDAESFTF